MRFILCLMCLMGCRESIATTAIIKGESGAVIPVERLFTIDGCGVYRLKDGINVGYVSVCPQVVCTTTCPTPTPKQRRLENENHD